MNLPRIMMNIKYRVIDDVHSNLTITLLIEIREKSLNEFEVL